MQRSDLRWVLGHPPAVLFKSKRVRDWVLLYRAWAGDVTARAELLERRYNRKRRPYPRPVWDRPWPQVFFPVLWGNKFPADWRPTSGFVDAADYRGLGEGETSVRACGLDEDAAAEDILEFVRRPPPMPRGQEPNARASLWNVNKITNLKNHLGMGTLNVLPPAEPESFERRHDWAVNSTKRRKEAA